MRREQEESAEYIVINHWPGVGWYLGFHNELLTRQYLGLSSISRITKAIMTDGTAAAGEEVRNGSNGWRGKNWKGGR